MCRILLVIQFFFGNVFTRNTQKWSFILILTALRMSLVTGNCFQTVLRTEPTFTLLLRGICPILERTYPLVPLVPILKISYRKLWLLAPLLRRPCPPIAPRNGMERLADPDADRRYSRNYASGHSRFNDEWRAVIDCFASFATGRPGRPFSGLPFAALPIL